MAIPSVSREALDQAMADFDATFRQSKEWSNWEENKAQIWFIAQNGKHYPPKKIISMAAGISVGDFSGGPESNSYLEKRGVAVTKRRENSLGEIFDLILDRYAAARASESFGGNHEIKELFTQARQNLENAACVTTRKNIHVVTSYGKGNWATIPWIALLDERETKTTQNGTYLVYLFRDDGKGCYLKLAQGVTGPLNQFGAKAAEELAIRATELRTVCTDLPAAGFDLSGKTDLGSDNKLAKLYEASTAASKYYEKGQMPLEADMLSQLDAALVAYDRFIARRGSSSPVALDARPIALIGTSHGILQRAASIKSMIESTGGFAEPWSFAIKDEAIQLLKPPFDLYIYVGKGRLAARLQIEDFRTSKGNAGLLTPWPENTDAKYLNSTNSGQKQSDVFKTWFLIRDIEILTPPLSVDDFELVIGLSHPESLVNQNSFGYVYNIGEIETVRATALDTPLPAKPIPPALPLEWLHVRTGIAKEQLSEMVEAILGPSPQIILAGPPGTSKTWVARQLALFLARDRPELVRFVQFHASYSYESFIEGLRPVSRGTSIAFERVDGVVCDVVRTMKLLDAGSNAGNEFVVVIDEANRANLPRVLGELMFLFEYREEEVQLQYSSGFSLPKNLRFIATMNTTDHSIRSIDVALRRRFDVFELGPDASILQRFYEGNSRNSVPDLIEGFNDLNGALETSLDRHHRIGHAFFMRQEMNTQTLVRIWHRKIFPLIEEFFFDQPELAREFSAPRFWPSVGRDN